MLETRKVWTALIIMALMSPAVAACETVGEGGQPAGNPNRSNENLEKHISFDFTIDGDDGKVTYLLPDDGGGLKIYRAWPSKDATTDLQLLKSKLEELGWLQYCGDDGVPFDVFFGAGSYDEGGDVLATVFDGDGELRLSVDYGSFNGPFCRDVTR